MIRAAVIAATLLIAGPALAAPVNARADAQARILDPAALRLVWPAALPSVTGAADGARFVGRMPSMSMAMSMPANARLIMRQPDDPDAIVTAPAGFEVVSAGPGRGYIVRTSYSPSALQALDGVLLGGELPGGSAASLDVAEAPAIAGRALLVVVQYN